MTTTLTDTVIFPNRSTDLTPSPALGSLEAAVYVKGGKLKSRSAAASATTDKILSYRAFYNESGYYGANAITTSHPWQDILSNRSANSLIQFKHDQTFSLGSGHIFMDGCVLTLYGVDPSDPDGPGVPPDPDYSVTGATFTTTSGQFYIRNSNVRFVNCKFITSDSLFMYIDNSNVTFTDCDFDAKDCTERAIQLSTSSLHINSSKRENIYKMGGAMKDEFIDADLNSAIKFNGSGGAGKRVRFLFPGAAGHDYTSSAVTKAVRVLTMDTGMGLVAGCEVDGGDRTKATQGYNAQRQGSLVLQGYNVIENCGTGLIYNSAYGTLAPGGTGDEIEIKDSTVGVQIQGNSRVLTVPWAEIFSGNIDDWVDNSGKGDLFVGEHVETIDSDASLTLGGPNGSTFAKSRRARYYEHIHNLTAHRDLTLDPDNAKNGETVTIARSGSGAFNLNIKDGATTRKSLTTGTWVEVVFNGTSWRVLKSGTL